MSIVKYANSEALIIATGSLRDLVADKATPETILKKVASLVPIANHLDDYIYVRHRAISAFEHYGANGNHDAFPQDELMKSYATFVNTGFFKDHNNDDPRKAFGLNLDAHYHPKNFIVLLTAVSRKMQGKLSEEMVANILANKWNQTSMGAAVGWSECSFCHNKATDPKEYCDHIRLAKGMVMDGHRIVEINHDLEFFEDSCITTEAADKDARMAEIYLPEDLAAPVVSVEALAGDFTRHIRTPHIKYRKSAAKVLDTNVSTLVATQLQVHEGGTVMPKTVIAETQKRPNEENPKQNSASEGQVSETDISDLSRSKQTVDSSGDNKNEAPAVGEKDQVAVRTETPDYGQSVKAQQEARIMNATAKAAEEKAAKEKEEKAKKEKEEKAEKEKKEASKKEEPKNRKDFRKEEKEKKNKKEEKKAPKKSKRIGVIRTFFSSLSNILGEDAALMGEMPAELMGEGGGLEGEEPEEKSELEQTLDLVKETEETVEQQKTELLGQLKSTVLASRQRRIAVELEELQVSETELLEVKHDLENLVEEEKEGEELHPDVVEKAVEEANEVVNEALNETDGKEEGMAPEEDGEEAATPEIAEKVSHLRKRANKKITAEEGDEMPGSPAGKADGGNMQQLPEAKDYNLAGDPWASYKSEIDSTNAKTEGQIQSQRENGFASKEERQSMGDKLKTAGKKQIRLYAEEGVAAPNSADLAKQIVDSVSDKMVEQIFRSNPETPEAQAGAAEVGQPPAEGANNQELFGTPPKQASKQTRTAEDLGFSGGEDRGSIGSDESKESPLPTSDDPADPSNDLFPEDEVTSLSGEANREQQSQLSQDLKAVFVPTTPGQQINPKNIYPTASGVPLEQKISEALNLAQQMVDAGLAQEADLESESKRLFRMSPDELKGVTAVLKTAATKKGFPHPDEGRGLVTSAIHFGSGGVFGENERDSAVLFDDDMALF